VKQGPLQQRIAGRLEVKESEHVKQIPGTGTVEDHEGWRSRKTYFVSLFCFL